MKKWTHTDCFAHYGTPIRNAQWGWSALNEETKTVSITCWQDYFRNVNGRMIYVHCGFGSETRRSVGFKFYVADVTYAQKQCDGLVRVVIARAEDENAFPRSIKEEFPKDDWLLRISFFDAETGTFAAEIERS